NGDADTDGMALPNTWYHIEFKLDWEANTHDFYVDGVLIEEGIPLFSPDDIEGDPDFYANLYVKKMTIGTDAGGVDAEQEAWIDQIKIQ
ncbi:MAG: hypothetical protein DRQ48_10560, partial [Gammaproteobacteria bacterium]